MYSDRRRRDARIYVIVNRSCSIMRQVSAREKFGRSRTSSLSTAELEMSHDRNGKRVVVALSTVYILRGLDHPDKVTDVDT